MDTTNAIIRANFGQQSFLCAFSPDQLPQEDFASTNPTSNQTRRRRSGPRKNRKSNLEQPSTTDPQIVVDILRSISETKSNQLTETPNISGFMHFDILLVLTRV